MSRLIDADALEFTHLLVRSLDDGHNWHELCVTKEDIDNAPTIVSDEAIVLDFTNITEEQKQQLVNLLSKTRIKTINKDVIWQNGYYACLNDKSIRESNWIPVVSILLLKNISLLMIKSIMGTLVYMLIR